MDCTRHLKPSLLAAYLGLLLYQLPADAQQAPDSPNEADNVDTVTVTGYRSSIEQSLNQKRSANAVIDVITAEDVSKFPDKNVADSLQRVPGVFIDRNGGEGSQVSIRGLSPELVLTELNGNYVASSEGNSEPNRSFNYVLLPANMISSVEVFKSTEARIDEGGVGGTVILHTRRPLDLPANTGFASLEGTDADTTKDIEPLAAGMYSWHSEDDRFGVLAGVTYQKRTNRSMEVNTETWRWWQFPTDPAAPREGRVATDVDGNPFRNDDSIGYWFEGGVFDQAGNRYSGYWIPQSVNFGIRDEERERKGAQVTLQFKPSDAITVTSNYFRFELSGDYTLNLNKIPEWGFSGDYENDQGRFLAPNGLTFDSSGTVVTGARFQVPTGGCSLLVNPSTGAPRDQPCTMETPQISGIYSREDALSQTADLAVEFQGDLFDLSVKGGRTWSEGGPSLQFRMSAKPRRFVSESEGQNGNLISAWDLRGTPTIEMSPEIQQNLMAGIAQIDVGSTDSGYNESRISQNYAQADLTKRFESSWIDSFQTGVKWRDAEVNRNYGRTYWYCPGTETRYQDCDAEAGVAQAGFFQSQPIGNIAGGFDANVFPAADFPAYIGYLNQRYGDAVRIEEPNFVYDVSEEIWAAYAQLNFKTERLRGNVGVRVAHTAQRIDSTNQITRQINYYVDGPGGPLSPPALCGASGDYNYNGTIIPCLTGFPVVIPEDQRRFEEFVPTADRKTFTDVLPSLNVSYEITPDLLLRGAVSKVIARPGYTDLGSQQQLTYTDPTFAYDREQFGAREGWAGSGGNRDLDPYEAWQYDLGVEWYFKPGSVVGLGLFRKDVKSFIVPLVIDQERTLEGETITVAPFDTQANGSDAVSQGVEVYAQYSFDFGLGFQANFTYNDTSTSDISLDGEVIGSSPLVGSAETQANLSLFYETGRFLVRASYNRRGEVVRGLQSGLNVYSEPYDQTDLNASFNITDNLQLTAAVVNLTDSEQREHLGDDTDARFYSNVYSGRRSYLGLTYKFQ
jgi:iron complex outermembrane receptor protein